MKKEAGAHKAGSFTRQEVQLVRGSFTPAEAADVILSLLDEKINFHKLQRLSWSEGQPEADTSYADQRIAELEAEKALARNFIREAREQGKLLKIKGTLEITMKNK